MNQLTRRRFGSLGAGAFLAQYLGSRQALAREVPAVSIHVDPSHVLAQVPADFMGLSYESGQLASPAFFSGQNNALISCFRTRSPSGVLRLGGNFSEFTHWSESGEPASGGSGVTVSPDAGGQRPRSFMITPESIRNLGSFLDRTNWRCIYGLNLAGGTLAAALEEGAFVAQTLGPRLVAVQFGNEPDLFVHHGDSGKSWTYEEFSRRWTEFREAFRGKLPHVAVAGPDTSNKMDWFTSFAQQQAQQVTLLTSHYYAGGPPSDPTMTAVSLLSPGKRFNDLCRYPAGVARAASRPYRISECNSCYGGGKPGVSDTFAASLWAADFCLETARLGCAGVNFHGGGNGFYSPIVGSEAEGFSARPEFYGLLLAQSFAGHTLQATEVEANGKNLTAYAAGSANKTGRIVIFNKDAVDLDISLAGTKISGNASLQRLRAPDLTSKTEITFAGGAVAADGTFHAATPEQLRFHAGAATLHLPAYSAALMEAAD